MKKRVFSMFLALVMVLGLLPATALAAEGDVAKFNGTDHATLAAALEAAKDETDIVIDLLADATLDVTAWQTLAIGGEATQTITINGNSHTLTFNQLNSDWNNVATNNNAKLILNNMTIDNSGHNNGPWNRHDINFACEVELNDVASLKALAFKAGATLKNVSITDSGDVYAIWVQPNGQTVSIDGLTVNAGRGIKIDEQYVDAPAKVELSVDNADFNTNKKAAIVVKSEAGAEITVGANVDISDVAADSTNVVWVDEDSKADADKVVVNGESAFVEGTVAKIGGTNFTSLQAAIDAAVAGDTITLVADGIAEDVTVVQAPNVAITIDGNGKTFKGTITVNGKSAAYDTAALTIQNVKFDATGISKDACINLGGTNAMRYTNHVTVSGCTFTDTDNSAVAIKNYTGGCKNLTITNCTATGMHSLAQVKGVEGLTVSGCTVDAARGMSIGTSFNVKVSGCTFNAADDKYGIRADGGDFDMTVENCTISAGLPIVVRNTTGDYALTLEGTNTLTAANAEGHQVTFTTGDDGTYVEPDSDFVVTGAEGLNVFPALPPELPKANAGMVEDNHDLTFALNFTIDISDMTDEEIAEVFEYYKDYFVDFELTSNKDMILNADGTKDGYLAGQYDEWSENWVNVPFEDVTLTAGQPIRIMDYAAKTLNQWGLRLRLYEIAAVVQDFDCGVYLTPEYMAANPDLQVTLKLNLYKPAFQYDGNSDVMVCPYGKAIELGSYTFPEAKYTVSMSGNGGKLPNGNNVFTIKNLSIYGDVELSNPGYTKLGYELIGWKTNKNIAFGTGVVSIAELAVADKNQSDTTIYITAQWKACEYEVTFDVNGGDALASNVKAVTFDSAYGELPAPTYIGYTFLGWFDEAGNEVTAETVYKIAGDSTLTAQWKAKTNITYKVQHLLLNASGDKVYKAHATYSAKGTTGKLTEAVALTNIEGYTALPFEQAIVNGDGSTVVKIYYARNNYTLTYDLDGGEFTDGTETVQTVQYMKKITAPADPVKEGYKFLGWNQEIPGTMPAEDVTITAQWEQITFTVTLNPTADGKVDPATVTVTYNMAIGELPVPTWAKSTTKATFLGWFDAEGNEVTAETIYTVLGDSTFTAKWLVHPGSSSTNVTKELFTIQCTEVHEHSWLCNWFGSHVTLVKDSVKWNEELGRWEAQAKISSSMLSNINSTQTKKNYFGGIYHYYDVSNYVFDLYYDPNFTGLNSQSKEVTGMWLPVKEYVVDVYCYTEPAAPSDATVQKLSKVIWMRDAANTKNNLKPTKLYADTYTVGEMYSKDGKFYVDLTITDLTPYIADFTKKFGEGYAIGSWTTNNTAEDFKFTLVYSGKVTDTYGYKQDGTGWVVDHINTTEKNNGRSLWLVKSYTVTYTDGGVGVFADETYTVEAATETAKDKFSATATPAFTGSTERTGYTFAGWTPALAKTVTADVTYTAGWTANEYTLNLDAGEGKVDPASVTVTYNEKIGELPVPTRTGYTFLGWVDADGNSVTAETVYTVAGDYTVYAQWEAIIYNITVIANEGGKVEVKDTAIINEIVPVTITANTGYRVKSVSMTYGSTTNSGFTAETKRFKMPAADVTIVVEFEQIIYNITVDTNVGGKVDVKDTAVYGEIVPMTVTPDLGYRVKNIYMTYGSTTNSGFTAETKRFKMPAADVVIHVEFEKIEYTITVVPSDHGTVVAKVNGVEADTATIGDVIEFVITPNEGYKFVKQNYYFSLDTGSGAGGSLKEGQTLTMLHGNVKVTPVFEACQYTVALNANGGTVSPSEMTVTYDATYAGLPTPTRTGYAFDGWFLGNTKVEAGTQVKTASDHELVAKWTANTYLLTCKDEPSKTDESKTVTYDQPVGTLPAPERTGYTFNGWFDAAGKQWTATSIVDFVEDKLLTAKWTANQYTVALNANGGSVAPTQITVTFDSVYGELPDPADREGYTFHGWALNGTVIKGTDKVATAADHELVAQWTINSHNVTYDVTGKWFAADETVNKTVEVVYGTQVEAIDAAKLGYVFSGWTTKDAYTVAGNAVAAGTALPVVMPDQAITVVGSYVRDVAFAAVELVLEATEVVYDGTAKTPAVTVTVDGEKLTEGKDYTVEYKNNIGSEAGAEGKATVIVTFIGDYTGEASTSFEFLYTVTFVTAGVTTPEKQYVKYGETAVNPGDSVKFGSDFMGWYTEGKTKYDFNTPVTKPITLTAQFVLSQIGGLITPPANTPVVTVNGLNTVDHMAYIIGSGDGKVNPLGTITRAEVATIFFRLMNDDFRAKYWDNQSSYADVAADAWYNVAVATLENAGIIKDTVTGGNFRPTALITRAELAVMAAQFALVSGEVPANTFVDVPATYWAAAEIAVVQYAGWIEGNNGMYRPDANLTRAECMTIVNRMLQRGAEAENMLADMTTFTDNAAGTWYYKAVQEATNSHTYNRTEVLLTGENFLGEKWVKMEAAPDWAALEKAWAQA